MSTNFHQQTNSEDITYFCFMAQFSSYHVLSAKKKLSLKISSLFSSPKIVILRCLIFIVTLNTEKCLSYSINLSHPNISIHISPYCLYISYGAHKDNLFNNQELLQMAIISLIQKRYRKEKYDAYHSKGPIVCRISNMPKSKQQNNSKITKDIENPAKYLENPSFLRRPRISRSPIK